MSETTYSYDSELLMKGAGLVATSAAALVSAAAKVVDIQGAGAGFGDASFDGYLVIDVTAIEIADNDELYTIGVQFSDSATFASGVFEAASLKLGAAEVVPHSVDSVTGRYVLPFCNRGPNGAQYRYMRVYTTVAGTVTTGINYTAFASRA